MDYLQNVDHRVTISNFIDLFFDFVGVRAYVIFFSGHSTQLKILFLQHFRSMHDQSVKKITKVDVNLRGLDVPLPSQLSRSIKHPKPIIRHNL